MKMDYSFSSEGILKKVLGYGYQIEPAALNILESLGEEKVIDVLDSFTKELVETNKFTLYVKIARIYDGCGLIRRCPKCNRWIMFEVFEL